MKETGILEEYFLISGSPSVLDVGETELLDSEILDKG